MGTTPNTYVSEAAIPTVAGNPPPPVGNMRATGLTDVNLSPVREEPDVNVVANIPEEVQEDPDEVADRNAEIATQAAIAAAAIAQARARRAAWLLRVQHQRQLRRSEHVRLQRIRRLERERELRILRRRRERDERDEAIINWQIEEAARKTEWDRMNADSQNEAEEDYEPMPSPGNSPYVSTEESD